MSLLLVHGVGGRPRSWHRVLERLDPALRRNALTADVRPEPGQDLHEIARHLLDSHPGSHVIVGHSLGGMLALEAALIEPLRVRGLVLVSAISGRPRASRRTTKLSPPTSRPAESGSLQTNSPTDSSRPADRNVAPTSRLTSSTPWRTVERPRSAPHYGPSHSGTHLNACHPNLSDRSDHRRRRARHRPAAEAGDTAASSLQPSRRTGHLAPLEAPDSVARAIERVMNRICEETKT